jgi:hypothetical protein
MRQRIATAIGVVIALMLAVIPLWGVPGAAAAQNGLQDGDAYESPQFGYTVEWGDDWDVRARDVISNRGGYDTLTLRGEIGTLWIQGQGSKVTAVEAVQKRIQIEGKDSDVVAQDLDGDVPMAQMVVGRNKILIEGYTLDTNEAVVIIVLSARERDFDEALASVQEQVLFNNGPILTGQDVIEGNGDDVVEAPTEEAEPTDAATEPVTEATFEVVTVEAATVEAPPVDLTDSATVSAGLGAGIYSGTLHGYTFQVDEIESDESDGLKLETATGTLTIWSWLHYGADPVACLDGEADFYGTQDENIEDWTPAEDANGDPIRYETEDYAYGVYTLTYTDPEDGETSERVDYIECRSIPGEDATVIIVGSSTPELYNDHLDTVLDVAETITFANEDASVVSQPATAPEEADIPESGLSGSLYTSPSFGFTVDIPPQWQVTDEQLAPNDEQIMLTNGTSDVMIWATDAYNGDLAGCVDFAAENAPYELVLAETAEGKPFLYDGGNEAYSISCQYIEESESVLILTQDVPADELASQRKFRIDLQQSIELP